MEGPLGQDVMVTLFDFIRFGVFATFGVGIGFMLLTNFIAWKVLRPAQKLGFLWWHVTSISLSFICIGIVATERVVSRLGDPPGWRSVLTLTGMTLYAVAQVIIFNVERSRLIQKRAFEKAAGVRERE